MLSDSTNLFASEIVQCSVYKPAFEAVTKVYLQNGPCHTESEYQRGICTELDKDASVICETGKKKALKTAYGGNKYYDVKFQLKPKSDERVHCIIENKVQGMYHVPSTSIEEDERQLVTYLDITACKYGAVIVFPRIHTGFVNCKLFVHRSTDWASKYWSLIPKLEAGDWAAVAHQIPVELPKRLMVVNL
jgi:hypothetical protein